MDSSENGLTATRHIEDRSIPLVKQAKGATAAPYSRERNSREKPRTRTRTCQHFFEKKKKLFRRLDTGKYIFRNDKIYNTENESIVPKNKTFNTLFFLYQPR